MGDGQEKTEASTLKHRNEARKQGTVARSVDLTSAMGIVALLLILPYAGSGIGGGAILALRSSFSNLPMQLDSGHILSALIAALRPMALGAAAIVSTAMIVGVAMNLVQVGFVISGKALVPSFARLNPLTGISRLASRNSAFNAAKALGKAIIFGTIAYLTLKSNWAQINSLCLVSPPEAVSIVGGIVRVLGIRVALAWGALAGLDYYFQKQQIERQLRMTKEEVKREMREAEMAPEVKAARNARRRRFMRRRLKEAVRSADVVVTNPTHFAVALKYEASKNHAPVVVAKGADYLAAKIREEAAEAGVPLIPNPPLARALYKQCEVGDYVPRDLFQAVAEVLAYVYRTLKRVPTA